LMTFTLFGDASWAECMFCKLCCWCMIFTLIIDKTPIKMVVYPIYYILPF
jgi:hypothetical protein